jgi:hypothetical protein
MTSPKAVHTVGASLVNYLKKAYDGGGAEQTGFSSCDFRLLSSGEFATLTGSDNLNLPTVSLYLFCVTIDEHLRNTRRVNGTTGPDVPLALNLHYLLTMWSDHADQEHTILAWVMRELYTHPVLDTSFLSRDADWQVGDVIQVIPAELKTEDLMRIWDALEPSYRLSVSYIARVVRLDPSAGAGQTRGGDSLHIRGDLQIMSGENVDRRILGALQIVESVTGAPIPAMMLIEATALQALNAAGEPSGDVISLQPGAVQLRRNKHGDYVILQSPGFEAYTRALYDLPNVTAVKLSLHILDPGSCYLPTLAMVSFPRDVTPPEVDQPFPPDSVFMPVRLQVFPSPAARVEVSWAVIRATVRTLVKDGPFEKGGARLPWALLHVSQGQGNNGQALTTGLADARGEALLALPGILVTMPAPDSQAVSTREITVHVQVAFDPALHQITDQDLNAASEDPNKGYVPNPEVLAASLKASKIVLAGRPATNTMKLAAGCTVAVDVLMPS